MTSSVCCLNRLCWSICGMKAHHPGLALLRLGHMHQLICMIWHQSRGVCHKVYPSANAGPAVWCQWNAKISMGHRPKDKNVLSLKLKSFYKLNSTYSTFKWLCLLYILFLISVLQDPGWTQSALNMTCALF